MTLNTKWISIIMPCFNPWEYLAEAIESVKTHLNWMVYEIIVSDDWSNDNGITEKVLDSYDWEKWIKIIKNSKNLGAQHARNLWLNLSVFPYIHMMDSDDKLNNSGLTATENYASRAINILQNDWIWFVHSSCIMFWWYNWYTISPYRLTEELVLKKHHVSTYMVYRFDDIMKEWIYNEDIKKRQDWSAWVWLLNARLKSWKRNEIEFINYPYYLYREHSTANRLSWWNVDEKEMILKTIKLYPEIFQKYYPNLNIEEIAEIVFLSKPSKLKDLLYVARFNSVDLAKKIVGERWWFISWNWINIDQLLQIVVNDWLEVAINIVNENNLKLLSISELWNIP